MSEIIFKVDTCNACGHGRKPGDVVAVKEDGSPWGAMELGGHYANPVYNPTHRGFAPMARVFTCAETGKVKHISENEIGDHKWFRILKCPKIPVSAAIRLTAEEPITNPRNTSLPRNYRAFHLDRSKIKSGPLEALAVSMPAIANSEQIFGRRAFLGIAVATSVLPMASSLPMANELLAYWDDDTRAKQFLELPDWDVSHLNAIVSRRLPRARHEIEV